MLVPLKMQGRMSIILQGEKRFKFDVPEIAVACFQNLIRGQGLIHWNPVVIDHLPSLTIPWQEPQVHFQPDVARRD